MPKKYYIITFGCQANVSDSERIAGILETFGFENGENEEDASLLIYNTCSVRQTAEDRIFGLNKKLKNLKIKNPKLKIILTGCMTHYSEKELKKRLPYINIFLPIKNKEKWFNVFKNFLLQKEFKNSNFESLNSYNSFIPKRESKFRALVPISYGCNNFCSYCVVPFGRGCEVSRIPEEIIKEITLLALKNYKEIWLLGQNVNSYKSGKTDFAKLLKMVNKIPGDFWIRFTSPHPTNFSDDLIKEMAKCKKFPHYLNLPAQSGDSDILKKMKRNYTSEEYIKLVEKIRKSLPDISISTDAIVGFPGETKKQFENTVKLFKKIKFDMAYISEYSERPNTLAARKYKDDIPKKEKEARKKYLTEILAKTALENNKKIIGKTLNVLIDKQKNSRFFGRTENNKVIEIIFSVPLADTPSNLKIGEFLNIKIISATPWKLKGEIA